MLSFYLALIQDEENKIKFENIYLAHHKTMLNVAFGITGNQHDAEEALSNALYAIARNIERIDNANELLLKSYLLKVVKNSAIDILRKRASERKADIDDLIALPAESDIMRDIEGDEEYKKLVKIIYNMPSTYRDVLVLRFLHGLKAREIADSLFISESSVKTKIRRGKKILSDIISEGKNE